MAKVYLLTEKDFEDLLARIDRDPKWGARGGSSGVLSEAERLAHEAAHRFYNYQLRSWIDGVKQ